MWTSNSQNACWYLRRPHFKMAKIGKHSSRISQGFPPTSGWGWEEAVFSLHKCGTHDRFANTASFTHTWITMAHVHLSSRPHHTAFHHCVGLCVVQDWQWSQCRSVPGNGGWCSIVDTPQRSHILPPPFLPQREEQAGETYMKEEIKY